ncbi:MAG: hypothetical protein AAGI49_02480, partial [Bacteroidota bacterium]
TCSDCATDSLTLTVFALGTYDFSYTIKGCNGTLIDNALVRIIASDCHENEPDDPCNLVQNGDFDCFNSLAELRENFANGFTNNASNSPDLLAGGSQIRAWTLETQTCCGTTHNVNVPTEFGDNAIGIWARCTENSGAVSSQSEILVLPLSSPLPPGASIDICLSAEGPVSCDQFEPRIAISFLTENFDDDGSNTNIANLCTGNGCTDIELIETPNDTDGNASFIDAGTNLVNGSSPEVENITIENNSAVAWTHLVISAELDCPRPIEDCSSNGDAERRAYLVIDNIAAKPVSDNAVEVSLSSENPCKGDGVNLEIEVCNESTSVGEELTVTLDIPEGYTLLQLLDFANGNTTIVPPLAPGECRQLTALVFVGEDAVSPGTVKVTIEGECTPPSEEEIVITPIEANPIVELEKTITCDPATGIFTVEILVDNLTDLNPLEDVVIRDQLPDGFSIDNVGDFNIQGGNFLSAVNDISGTQTFSYTMTASIFCEEMIVPCATAGILGRSCPEVPACVAPLEDCRAELELDASFTYEQICDPQDGTFVVSFMSAASVQGSEYEHTWDFGVEGISTDVSTEPNPTYDGYTAGNFKVVHTVSNACFSETFTEILKLGNCDFLCMPSGCGGNIFKIKGPVSVSQLSDVDANGNPIYVEGNSNATCYQIRGVLTIDVPFALVDKQVTMEPGSAVIVNPNVKLSIENSDISSCKMWTGITVEAAGNLDIFDNSSIQDAIDAVQLVEGSNFLSLGTLFDRNVVGIRMNGTPNLLGFQNNTFSCSSNLNEVSDATNGGWGYVGIISNAASYAIGNLDQTSTVINTFKDMDYGVICSRGSVFIADAKFENLRKVVNPLPFGVNNSSSIGIYGYLLSEAIFSENQFSNLSTGIYAAVCPLRAQYNDMVAIEQGIRYNGPIFQYLIADNEIAPSEVGIYVSGGAALSGRGPKLVSANNIQLSGGEDRNRGVVIERSPFIDGSRVVSVSDNTININNTSSILFQAIHILSSNDVSVGTNEIDIINVNQGNIEGITLDGGSEHLVNSNRFRTDLPNGFSSNSVYGIIARSSSDALYCNNFFNGVGSFDGTPNQLFNSRFHYDFSFYGICDRSNVAQNKLGNATVGIYLQGGSRIGLQRYRGNEWNGDVYEDWHALYNGTAGNALLSQFIVNNLPFDSSGEFDFFPDNLFDVEPSGEFGGCISEVTNIANSDEAAARGKSSSDVFNWEASNRLSERLNRYPNLLGQSSVVDSFYQANSNSTVESYSQIGDLIAMNSQVRDTVLDTDTKNNLDSIELLLSELTQLSQDYQNANSTVAQNNIQNDINSLNQDIIRLSDEVATIFEQLEQNTRSNLSYAYQLNEAIVPENDFASDAQFVNRIALSSNILVAYEVSTSDANELLMIANQCPLEGGNVVWQARDLYNSLVSTTTFNDENCQ